jgi:hypothetical protein
MSGSICPDCKSFVGGEAEACPCCGRASALSRRGGGAWWLWRGVPLGLAALLALVFVKGAVSPGPEPVRVGGRAVVVGRGAWFAVDDPAWEELLDNLTADDEVGLAGMAEAGRAFFEPPGSYAKVHRKAVGSVQARVISGKNPGLRGWTQAENLRPAEVTD